MAMKKPDDRSYVILARDVKVPSDDRICGRNANALLVGSTGSGKTRYGILPNLLNDCGSTVIIGAKDVLQLKPWFERLGYDVRVLDLAHPERSTTTWDPYANAKTEQQVSEVNYRLVAPHGLGTADPFWTEAAWQLMNALAWLDADRHDGHPTWAGVMKLVGSLQEKGDRQHSLVGGDNQASCVIDDICWQVEHSHAAAELADAEAEESAAQKRLHRTGRNLRASLNFHLGNIPEAYDFVIPDGRGGFVGLNEFKDKEETEQDELERDAIKLALDPSARMEIEYLEREHAAALGALTDARARVQHLRNDATPTHGTRLWKSARNSAERTWRSICISLTSAVQAWTTADLMRVLCAGPDPINLADPAITPCHWIVVLPDMSRAVDPLAHIFLSQLMESVFAFADSMPGGRTIEPVHVVIDDACSYGAWSDLGTVAADARSRGVRVTIACQGLDQLVATYGGAATGIMASCDNFVLMGPPNDLATAKYVAELAGVSVQEILRTPVGKVWVRRRGEATSLHDRYEVTEHPNYREAMEVAGRQVA